MAENVFEAVKLSVSTKDAASSLNWAVNERRNLVIEHLK
jgi:hypothetical protein